MVFYYRRYNYYKSYFLVNNTDFSNSLLVDQTTHDVALIINVHLFSKQKYY